MVSESQGTFVRSAAFDVGQPNANAAVMAAFIVDLEDADRGRSPRRGEVRAAASLAVEAGNLDDANLAVRRRRRRHRTTTDQAMLGMRLVRRHVDDQYGDVLTDEIVHWAFERA